MWRNILLCFLVFCAAHVESRKFTGKAYADNWFRLWVNGKEIVSDPITWAPHNFMEFEFYDDADCRTYAIYARDAADEVTGLTYDDTCVGDGGFRVWISDGTISNTDWKVKTIHYGPENWNTCYPDVSLKCMETAATGCTSRIESYDADWCSPRYDHSDWVSATEFTEDVVGWGRPPNTSMDHCEDPSTTSWGDAKFIWAGSLRLDNFILLRYTTCDPGSYPSVEDGQWTCNMGDVPPYSVDKCSFKVSTGTGLYVSIALLLASCVVVC